MFLKLYLFYTAEISQRIHIGGTVLHVGNTQPYDNVLVQMSSTASAGVQFNTVLSNMDNNVFDDIGADIVEIYEGSIYFHLSTCSPQILLSILNDQDDTKLKVFLARLFDKNRQMIEYFGKDTVIELRLTQIPPDSFICNACCQVTLRKNYRLVVDEIEDDIIEDTLKRLKDISEYQDSTGRSSGCILDNKTRYQKAVTFLQYVLCNEDVLQSFIEVFNMRSQVNLTQHKCRSCSGSNGTHSVQYKEKIFHFTIRMNDLGIISVLDVQSGLPAVARKQEDQPDLQRKLLRAMSVSRFIGFGALQEYRIVVVDETAEADTINFLDACKTSVGNILNFYQLPSIRKYAADIEGRKNIAHCIALTSPGPHAFVLISNVTGLLDLKTTLKVYGDYFGLGIMKHLIVVFKTDELFQFAVEDYIEHSSFCQNVLQQCGNRYIIFANRSDEDKKPLQMIQLCRLITTTLRRNDGMYYSNSVFQESERAIKNTEKKMESQKQTEIRNLENRIRELKWLNTRDKATEEVYSQESYVKMISSTQMLSKN